MGRQGWWLPYFLGKKAKVQRPQVACVSWRTWHYFRSAPEGQLWSKEVQSERPWCGCGCIRGRWEQPGKTVGYLWHHYRAWSGHRMWPSWLRDQWGYGENPEHKLTSEYDRFFWSRPQLGHLWTCVLPFRSSVVQKEEKQSVEGDMGLVCSGGTRTGNILWSLHSFQLHSFDQGVSC